MIRAGDMGFGGKRKGWYPAAVRWFTRSRWSHCFIVMPEYLGEISVLEADLKVQLVPFQKEYVEKDADYYEIWRPISASSAEILEACRSLYKSDAGEIYGFMQIPWFAARSLLAKIGIKLSKNWFPAGEICSETPWTYLRSLSNGYCGLSILFGENETSPEDVYNFVVSRPDLFELVTRRD